jgi:tetratricopeptide (TPR) repeat protein
MRTLFSLIAMAAAMAQPAIADDLLKLDIASAYSPFEVDYTVARCKALDLPIILKAMSGISGESEDGDIAEHAKPLRKWLRGSVMQEASALDGLVANYAELLLCHGESKDALEVAESIFDTDAGKRNTANIATLAARAAMALGKERTAAGWLNKAGTSCAVSTPACAAYVLYLQGKVQMADDEFGDAATSFTAARDIADKSQSDANLELAAQSALVQTYARQGRREKAKMELQTLAKRVAPDSAARRVPVYANATDYSGKTRTERSFYTYRFTVNPDGGVSDITLQGSFGSGSMEKKSAEALRNFLFIPAFNGAKLEARAEATFTFRFGIRQSGSGFDKKGLERLQSRSSCVAC